MPYDRWLSVDGLSLHVLVTDEPSPTWLALWPGLGGTASEFSHLLEDARDHQVNVLALDPPGHGASPSTDRLRSEAVYGTWDAALHYIAAQDGRRILIGGHSYGGYAALMAAKALLPRIHGLVLLDGGYLDPFPTYERERVKAQNQAYLTARNFPSWDEFLEQERRDARTWDPFIEHMVRATMKEENGRIVPVVSLDTCLQVCDLLSRFRVDALPHLTVPALLLCATQPEEMKKERALGAAALAQKIAGLSVASIPDSGHDLLIDNPRDTAAQVWAFVQTLAD